MPTFKLGLHPIADSTASEAERLRVAQETIEKKGNLLSFKTLFPLAFTVIGAIAYFVYCKWKSHDCKVQAVKEIHFLESNATDAAVRSAAKAVFNSDRGRKAGDEALPEIVEERLLGENPDKQKAKELREAVRYLQRRSPDAQKVWEALLKKVDDGEYLTDEAVRVLLKIKDGDFLQAKASTAITIEFPSRDKKVKWLEFTVTKRKEDGTPSSNRVVIESDTVGSGTVDRRDIGSDTTDWEDIGKWKSIFSKERSDSEAAITYALLHYRYGVRNCEVPVTFEIEGQDPKSEQIGLSRESFLSELLHTQSPLTRDEQAFVLQTIREKDLFRKDRIYSFRFVIQREGDSRRLVFKVNDKKVGSFP